MFEEYAKRAAQAERGGQRQAARNFETSSPHMQNFIDCVRSRKNPIAPVEAGTSSACEVSWSRSYELPDADHHAQPELHA